MPEYRCFFFDAAHHIFEVDSAILDTDPAAREWGHQLSQTHPSCAEIEIWCGPRLVYTEPCQNAAADD